MKQEILANLEVLYGISYLEAIKMVNDYLYNLECLIDEDLLDLLVKCIDNDIIDDTYAQEILENRSADDFAIILGQILNREIQVRKPNIYIYDEIKPYFTSPSEYEEYLEENNIETEKDLILKWNDEDLNIKATYIEDLDLVLSEEF